MALNYNQYSRFKTTEEIIYQNKETMSVWKKPAFLTKNLNPNLVYSFQVTAEYNGRPDLISNRLYKTPYYDWVLLAFNNVTETLNWPPTGLIIKYPDKTLVSTRY